jgi:creatinine amidohydrolase/Fe(II)-dependent formamide hydrolase-like protein
MGFKAEKFTASYFGKTAEQQIAFYQELLYHTLVQMNTLEMRAVCLCAGHYPLSEFAQPAVQRFNDSYKDTQAFAAKDPEWVPQNDDVGGDHAAKWETSYLWYLRPDCVDTSIFLGRDDEKQLDGVIGIDPRGEASVEVGRRGCDLIVDAMIRKAEELMRAAGWVAP